MPTIRQSAKVSTQGWEPAPQTPATPSQTPAMPAPETNGRSSFMLASMPLMASTGDAFTRQFYSSGNLPQIRTLPAKKGSGA